MNTIDLQIQSTLSDGKLTPTEIVTLARERNLAVIALTDHDTVDGISEALSRGSEQGIRVIPGIEISVADHHAHLLGYGIDHRHAGLLVALESARNARIESVRETTENLKKNEGFAVEWDDVLHDTPGSISVTRLHLVRAIMKRPENQERLKGVTKKDFFDKFLQDGGRNYMPRLTMSAQDAIGYVHAAGGAAVWSHPAIHFRSSKDVGSPVNPEALETFLQELISWGIDGIEVFNPSHTEDDVELMESLAVKYDCARTAGSDFHDTSPHPRDPGTGLHSADTPGDYETYGFSTDGIVERLDEAILRRRGGGV